MKFAPRYPFLTGIDEDEDSYKNGEDEYPIPSQPIISRVQQGCLLWSVALTEYVKRQFSQMSDEEILEDC